MTSELTRELQTMQDGPTSDGVLRLKELLFEPESQALAALRERIDALSESDRRIHQDLVDRLQRLAAAEDERRADLLRRLADAGDQRERERLALEQQLAEVARHEERERRDILLRIEGLLDRAGTAERFQASVAASLDGALRAAEVDRHKELSEAMAPLVVRTIKTEIRASHDELADALYPHMGRMVKSYVASAMKDLAEQINRRLEQNPLMLRLRSITTGRPMSELAMADSMRLEVEELYLIRRGTGELIGRWPEAPGAANRDHVLGGTLAAINEFASDALSEGGTSLRRIDLDSAQVYLRASPMYLLAAKCSGSAPDAVEQVIDEAFLAFIEQHHDALAADAAAGAGEAGGGQQILPALADAMKQQVATRQAETAAPSLGFAPLKWAAALILLPLVAWLAWSWYLDWRTSTTREAALAAIAATGDLRGYRTHVDVARGGRALTVVGLTPSETVRSAALARVAERLPGVQIRDELVVLPNSALQTEQEMAALKRNLTSLETTVSGVGRTVSGVEREVGNVQREVGNVQREVQSVGSGVREVASAASGVRRDLTSVETELARVAERRALQRAASRLDQMLPDLATLETELGAGGDREVIRRAIAQATELRGEIRTRLISHDTPPPAQPSTQEQVAVPLMQRWRQMLAVSADELAALIGQRRRSRPASESVPGSTTEAAEDVAAGVERLAAIAAAVEQANALRLSLPPPPPPPPPQIVQTVAPPTPRERLAAFVREHAIFFANGTEYRDGATSEQTLGRLAGLIRETDVLVRIVGYTDERGGQQRNTSLSQLRADKVLEALVRLGIPRERLVAVGRINSIDLSPSSGAGSPNRRVEFEIGFFGEGGAP